ncbi:hypothetical protein NQ314_018263 [Rhamnusium bicolor]|uniref:Pseudouridine-5'-phosphatase n=1 Tax=Rhamnusium bicolor TaxID=1586634 RepID=A0AAV8WSC1_9CUCU|nr:hypothetical protein NQ314_018263 [Rhamnusium bicolor]
MKQQCCPGPKFKQVTHVIFDLDGTILDTEEIYINAMTEIGARYGKVFTNDMSNQISGSCEKDSIQKAIDLMELPLTPEELLNMYKEIICGKLPNCPLMPGAENMIRHLHSNNIPIAVATSSAQDSYDLKTKCHKEIFDLFHHIVCGGSDPEVSRGKPFPDIFLICASRFPDNPDPSKCLVFEDAPNGVQGALSAGMQVVMIPNIRVPYDIWRTATLRLDSFDFMVPGAFGLPPFPSEEGDSPIIRINIGLENNSPTEGEPMNFPTEEQINPPAVESLDEEAAEEDTPE